MKQDLGPRIYCSRMRMELRVFIFLIFFILFYQLYIKTTTSSLFIQRGYEGFSGFFKFLWFYPENLIFFLITVLLPTLYYGFIRSIKFYEKGILINRGLPFFYRIIMYDQLHSYKIINNRYLLSIKRKDNNNETVLFVNNLERAIAILDSHNIDGVLGSTKQKNNKSLLNKKLYYSLLIAFLYGLVIYLIIYFYKIKS